MEDPLTIQFLFNAAACALAKRRATSSICAAVMISGGRKRTTAPCRPPSSRIRIRPRLRHLLWISRASALCAGGWRRSPPDGYAPGTRQTIDEGASFNVLDIKSPGRASMPAECAVDSCGHWIPAASGVAAKANLRSDKALRPAH